MELKENVDYNESEFKFDLGEHRNDFKGAEGYGTKRHYEALREYGPCPAHRRTFLRSFYGR